MDPPALLPADEKMITVDSLQSISSSFSDGSNNANVDNDHDSSNKDGSSFASSPEPSSTLQTTRGYSRHFSPYRILGIVADGPFDLIPNQNASDAMVCVAIGERFHLVQCDGLHPVLVSHAIPGTQQQNGPQKIYHLVSDNSLSVTVVAHGFITPRGNRMAGPRRISLFQRNKVLATLGDICEDDDSTSDHWSIMGLLHLGKIKMAMKEEKKDKIENAALIAVVLSMGKQYDDTVDGVPIVGEDSDSDESDGNSEDANKKNSNHDDLNRNQYRGAIVLLVASRTSLTVSKRIKLNNFPSFCPRVAIHPPTYVNKIIIGGFCSKLLKDSLVLLNFRTGKIIHVFKCLDKFSPGTKSEITCLEASPAIDTIALGNSKGVVHMINIRHDKLLFSLKHEPKNDSKDRVCITTMSFRTDGSAFQDAIAPLAIGRSDGTITVWDLSLPNEVDEDAQFFTSGRTILCELERVHYPDGVCKLQFLPQEPLLISTGRQSNSLIMHIFDSPDHNGRILRQRRGHSAPPKCIRYLYPTGAGILANMGDDTDARACQIISGGSNDQTLMKFSTVRSVLDKEFSQGRGLEKKSKEFGLVDKTDLLLPPITAITTSEMRSQNWGDLVSIHQDHAFAYVWSSKTGAQSGPILRQDNWNVSVMIKQPPKSAHATSVSMSTCGNYALVGTKGGIIYKYNVQSGMSRGTYPIDENNQKNRTRVKDAGDIRRALKELEKKTKLSNRASNQEMEEFERIANLERREIRSAKLRSASHRGYAVTGIAVDSINRAVITVGSDAKLILWSFETHAPHKKSPTILPAPATKLCHVKDSNLTAIALNDYSTVLFDCSNLNIVRRFGCGTQLCRHTGPISDIGFSPDARNLYTSSLDGTIRVWDVPTNSCVDWLSFSTPPTSLTVSPTGEFLATTHSGSLGISLWSDRSFYQTTHVDGTRVLSAPSRMDDPSPIAETDDELDNETVENSLIFRASAIGEKKGKPTAQEEGKTNPAKAREEGLITLSGLPQAHWKNLFHLELVRERNKPKEPPQKPPSAPFFLQWRPGIDVTREVSTNSEKNARNRFESNSNQNDQWDAVWSDDDDEEEKGMDIQTVHGCLSPRELEPKRGRNDMELKIDKQFFKKRRFPSYRSKLASLLQECSEKARTNFRGNNSKNENVFVPVTEYVSTLGPSAMDVSLSTLCNGEHDLEEGLSYLILASRWLIEACQSRERFDAVNAYLHRFLYLHFRTLSSIDEISDDEKNGSLSKTIEEVEQPCRQVQQRNELLWCITKLKTVQNDVAATLQEEIQNALCLLRHVSRML